MADDSVELRAAFEEHLEVTKGQVKRLGDSWCAHSPDYSATKKPLHYLEETSMFQKSLRRMGNARWGCAAWLLGLPLPFVILAFLFGGCNR